MQATLDLGIPQGGAEGSIVVPPRKAHVRQQLVFRSGSEPELYPVDADALLPEDHAARGIRAALKSIDLSGLRELYEDHGGVPYRPEAMLGILLLAYQLGVTGSRKVEEHCLYDIRFIHVGYGLRPDYRTFARFRRRVGPYLKDLFTLVVAECKAQGLVTMRRVALDGTKCVSAASQLGRWMTNSEKADLKEVGLESPESSDPDARTMKGAGGFVLGYNCQAAVDCDSGIVVAASVTDNSADCVSLAPMAKQIVETVGKPQQLVADAGYDSNEGICACSALELDAIVAQQNPTGLFWTAIPQEDKILCPMGNELISWSPLAWHGKSYQVYKVEGCTSCMFFGSCCSASSVGRLLRVPQGCNPAERVLASHRARSPEAKIAMIERMATIEPVFADICHNKGLRRFKLRGTDGARIEWSLVHIARNLTKLTKARKGHLRKLFMLLFLSCGSWECKRLATSFIRPKLLFNRA